MSDARKPAARKASARKAGAARREKSPAAPTVEFRGLELKLPKQPPGTLWFDLFALDDEDIVDPGVHHRLLKTLIGDEQTRLVRAKVAEDGVSLQEMGELIDGLFESIWAAYGTSTGESSASSTS